MKTIRRWMRRFQRRESPAIDVNKIHAHDTSPEFKEFLQALGPDFWPVCPCFTQGDRERMIQDIYVLASQAADNLMGNMAHRTFCITTAPTILALMVNRVIMVGSTVEATGEGSLHAELGDSAVLANVTDQYGDFQVKLGRLSANAMEKLGCIKS